MYNCAGNWGYRPPKMGAPMPRPVRRSVSPSGQGSGVAGLPPPFGVQVLFYDAYPPPTEASDDLESRRVELNTHLSKGDVTTVLVPLYAETRNMIDAITLARMNDMAVLANTSRGEASNE